MLELNDRERMWGGNSLGRMLVQREIRDNHYCVGCGLSLSMHNTVVTLVEDDHKAVNCTRCAHYVQRRLQQLKLSYVSYSGK
jgi:hypothetical protein